MELEPSLLALAIEAIPGASPFGIAVKYEDSFQALEAELAKQEALTAATVDWRLVDSLARSILSEQSKDILVASYLAMALVQNQGYGGMLQGFSLLHRMSEQWWDDMFPPLKRIRGRAAAVTWLTEKVNWYIESKPPIGEDLSFVPALYDVVSLFDQFLAEKMADKAPDMTGLIRPLRQLKKTVEAESRAAEVTASVAPQTVAQAASEPSASDTAPTSEPQSVATVKAPEPAAQATASSSASASSLKTDEISADVGSDSDANKAIRQIQGALRKLSTYYADTKPAEPRRYRLGRYALWLNVDAMPPNKDGKTQVPPPAKDLASKFQQLLDQSDFASVVDQVERQLIKLPYWFEGHRLLVSAMEQLGGSHQGALHVVRSELRSLLERLPGLLELSYSDGTPFADDQTRFWVTQTILASGDESSGGGAQDDALREVHRSAVKLAASGKVNEAVDELQSFARHCGSRREEYHARLALAEVLMDSGQSSAALPILDRLGQHIETHGLSDWEPDFARRCYQLLYQVCQREATSEANNTDELKLRQAEAYTKLCWFDPGAAVT